MKKLILSICIFLLSGLNVFAFYNDVPLEHPNYNSIKSLYDLGKLPEEANNQFHPDEKLKRPDLYKLILSYAQAAISPTANLKYKDTDNNAEYAPYLQTAIDIQMLNEGENEEFGINRAVSKHLALSTMFETLGIGTPSLFSKEILPFIDIKSTSFIAPVAKKAAELGIVEQEESEKFKLAKRITRGEAVEYLYKIYKDDKTPTITLTVENFSNNSQYTKTEQELLNNENFSIFLDVWSRLQNKYYYQEDINDDNLIRGAIKGMVDKLSDKYSVYEEPSESGNLLSTLSSEYEGIGIIIELIEDQITIIAPFQDSPAEKAGLKANDTIIEINGENVIGQTLDYAASKIKGPAGSEVKIKVLRDKTEKSFTTKRASITNTSVKSKLIEENGKKIGYISMMNFGRSSYQEFKDAATELIAKNPAGFIIDLRNNPGGYLDAAVDIIGLFTTEKKTAVILKNADGSQESLKTDGNGLLNGYKIIVLINQGSASASEIMAGALQDYKIAKLIGTTSFGKGSAQEVRQYYDESLFKYTISKWLTPNRQEIDKKGLSPDKAVEDGDNDPQLKAAKAEF